MCPAPNVANPFPLPISSSLPAQPPASHAHASSASGAIADNSAVEKDSDEDSDPDLQEVYVQAYACQMFRDDAAAAAVEDGVHLRPLAASQVRHFCDGSVPTVRF